MAVVITCNGSPGNLTNPAIGSAVALSEQGGFAGVVSSVLWTMTKPPNSIAALSETSAIRSAPFTNAFTPDVGGVYRIRLVVTYANGATETDTVLVLVQLAYALSTSDNLPAPLESTERGESVGWADAVNSLLLAAHSVYSGSEYVTAVNATGGDLVAGQVVELDDLERWSTESGGSTVFGSDDARIATASLHTLTSWQNLALVTADVSAGAKFRALRRGVVALSTAGMVTGDVLEPSSSDGTLTPISRKREVRARPCGKVLGASVIWFDPAGGELARDRRYTITLQDGVTGSYSDGSALLPRWNVTKWVGAVCGYSITRGAANVECGILTFAFQDSGGSAAGSVAAVGTSLGTVGVTFAVTSLFGDLVLTYTSTATGVQPVLQLHVIQEFPA